ncbi:MAG: MlaD family protein [Paludibacter sp.]|nr:MlaD family protein [Paludibacter sp.]
METRSQKFKARLGFFVAGGILIFIMAVFIIGKQKNLFNPVFKLTSSFYNVGGLKVGNNIRFSGINVGTVDNIRIINDSTVEVEMLIRQEIRKFIKSDSKAAIGSEGLIGDKLLIITQGSTDASIVELDQQLESIEPIEIDAIIASLKLTVAHTEVVTEELAETMMKINSGRGTLGRLIHDTEIAQNLSNMDISKTPPKYWMRR